MNWKRILGAIGLSLMQPGLGQLFNRQLGKAIWFMASIPGLILIARITNLLHSPRGLATWFVLSLGFSLWAMVDAVRNASRPRDTTDARMNRLALAFVIVLFLGNVAGLGGEFYIKQILRVHAYTTASDAMIPTLREGDRILVDENAYSRNQPQRGDVVVFIRDGFGDTVFPKRVIAVGGDVIEGADRVKVNGVPLSEPYLSPLDNSEDATAPFGPLTVPTNKFFMMGDNRQDSFDSREYGFVDRSQLRGKILYRYWSPDHSRIGTAVR